MFLRFNHGGCIEAYRLQSGTPLCHGNLEWQAGSTRIGQDHRAARDADGAVQGQMGLACAVSTTAT